MDLENDVYMMVMTSPKTSWALDGFFWLLNKYTYQTPGISVHIFGFDENSESLAHFPAYFHSFGKFKDYPRNRWSDTFLMALDFMEELASTFWFMMDDYWVIRGVDIKAVRALNKYVARHSNIVKMDLATDRLYALRGEPYLYGKRTVDRIVHLDLIESPPESAYHMSLWTGIWKIELLRQIILPGETAQEIEIAGTERLRGTDLRVMGTRQAPVLHTNIIRGGGQPIFTGYEIEGVSVNGVHPLDLALMKQEGVRLNGVS